ncbi:hypothetical protein ABIE52_006852 [Rhodococcus sp. OAS809]|uniref:hypothetical protein n=1 Tax=Rhodococcus sp. OAS809 TaxID=2663874 RepID=UPI0017890C34
MSRKNGAHEQAPPKKYPLRLQMPVDDPDVDAFLAAQGVRFQSQAIVMLIRMWVNEFGPVNVLEQTMGSLTATTLKGGPSTTPIAASGNSPVAAPAPQAQISEPVDEEISAPVSVPEPEPEPVKPAPKPAPSDDIHDMFRQ